MHVIVLYPIRGKIKYFKGIRVENVIDDID